MTTDDKKKEQALDTMPDKEEKPADKQPERSEGTHMEQHIQDMTAMLEDDLCR